MGNFKSQKIVTVDNLQTFFFESLSKLNCNLSHPLPEEAIFYSSDVLDRYTLSKDYFEKIDGKVQEKVLGLKLLEASHKSKLDQEKIYRDVAETTLILCGCFANSVNEKIVSHNYYRSIGKIAFSRMNSYRPSFMNMPSFFEFMANSFESVTRLLSLMEKYHSPEKLLAQNNLSDQDAAILGIINLKQEKVS